MRIWELLVEAQIFGHLGHQYLNNESEPCLKVSPTNVGRPLSTCRKVMDGSAPEGRKPRLGEHMKRLLDIVRNYTAHAI